MKPDMFRFQLRMSKFGIRSRIRNHITNNMRSAFNKLVQRLLNDLKFPMSRGSKMQQIGSELLTHANTT
uniref:Uncharacterized protein n=1 Tax=Rhizophora mucronata TaxID=61149 RepID=A0A2P2NR27_RHIMU